MAVTLYDQFGRPLRSAEQKKPERRPLAVAPVLDSFREYVTDGLTPERLATVFKEADQGDMRRQAQLFEQLEEKDGHLVCERDKRKNVILDLDFQVQPATDDSRDQKVADFVTGFFEGHARWADCLTSLQDAVGKGYAAMETFWDVSSGQAMPEKFEFIEQKRFQYTDAKGILRRYPLLLTDEDAMGVEVPPWKLILHQYGGMSGHPTRSGIYRVAAWMILFKHYAIKDWVIFCEVYGMPLRLGKYDQGASDGDKQALITAISSLGSDAAGIISKSTEIEFVESAKGSTAADLWKLLASFANGEVSKAMLGQTLSAEVGDKGSYAASKTHNEVRLDLLRADGRALAATIRNQLIRPLVGFNFGWDAELPKFTAVFEEQEDLGAKAEWIEKITDKIAVPVSWMRKEFNIPEPEEDEEIIGGKTDSDIGKLYKYHLDHGTVTVNEVRERLGLPPTKGGDRFTEPVAGTDEEVAAKMITAKETGRDLGFTDEQQAIEGLADTSIKKVDLSSIEKSILQAVQAADSYEQATENVLALYPDLDMSGLQEAMEQGLLMAEIYGRKVVADADQT